MIDDVVRFVFVVFFNHLLVDETVGFFGGGQEAGVEGARELSQMGGCEGGFVAAGALLDPEGEIVEFVGPFERVGLVVVVVVVGWERHEGPRSTFRCCCCCCCYWGPPLIRGLPSRNDVDSMTPKQAFDLIVYTREQFHLLSRNILQIILNLLEPRREPMIRIRVLSQQKVPRLSESCIQRRR